MKIVGMILCLGGIVLVSLGVWKSKSTSPLEQSATRYLDALKDGDAARMLAELSPELQNAISESPVEAFSNLRPDSDLNYSIVLVNENENTGRPRVVAELVKQGYRIRPILHYAKRDGRWCIVRTSNLKTDPRWELGRLKRDQNDQQDLEKEVKGRFENIAGVSVKALQ